MDLLNRLPSLGIAAFVKLENQGALTTITEIKIGRKGVELDRRSVFTLLRSRNRFCPVVATKEAHSP